MLTLNEPIIVTGAAGFIGAAISKKLLEEGNKVIGIDNINDYYDVDLKKRRLDDIKNLIKKKSCNWVFHQISIEENDSLDKIFNIYKPKIIIHLAAQAGVRNSIKNPGQYIQSNLVGFANVLEACRKHNIKNLIYASSSSVYGGNRLLPYHEDHNVNHPVSLYAATKKSNELMAHSYSHLYGIPATGLRFFTVYGPWGRPDMAPMIFTKSIFNDEPIDVFNNGDMKRDFTYIDDIIEGIFRCCSKPATSNKYFDELNPHNSLSFAPHRIFNIGNSRPINLLRFIELLEEEIGKKAIKQFKPMQAGDVKETSASTDLLNEWVNFKPKTSIENGVKLFIEWYKRYYNSL